MGGAVQAPKEQALRRNFDGTNDAYGEASMYDSDDETYGMKKAREQAIDAEAHHYRTKGSKSKKKKKKGGGSDDDEE